MFQYQDTQGGDLLGIRKPLGLPEQYCEQGGCFILPGVRSPLGHPEQNCEQ
ncbi:hypothetical protein HPO07_27660, partial [Klebsiella pneumoniae]|nr:hypothetical protein [Klebsiella pneumoniae]